MECEYMVHIWIYMMCVCARYLSKAGESILYAYDLCVKVYMVCMYSCIYGMYVMYILYIWCAYVSVV